MARGKGGNQIIDHCNLEYFKIFMKHSGVRILLKVINLFITPNVLVHRFSFCFTCIQFLILQTFSSQLLPFPNDPYNMFVPVSDTSPLFIQISTLSLSRVFLLKQGFISCSAFLLFHRCFFELHTLLTSIPNLSIFKSIPTHSLQRQLPQVYSESEISFPDCLLSFWK